jgi:cholesterol oxidase
MADHFDAIVVGSGFGGSVMAYELASAGRRVCVLERGQPYPPGSFPRSPYRMSRNFWDPSEGFYGLFDLWSFAGTEALIASGLGGGSLIYANVLLRKPEKWFVREDPRAGGYEYWPVTREDLEPHYDAVERAIGVQAFPLETAPYNQTAKTKAFRRAAHDVGLVWSLPPLAVTFANQGRKPVPGEPIDAAYPNLHGAPRATCRSCGECDLGCNFGSKNTLDLTYLSMAKHTGNVDIRTLCEARTLAPLEGGRYEVGYVEHDLSREGTKTHTSRLPLRYVTARFLILSAGTLGSTYLLLRNRQAFGIANGPLGTRFCTNGDLLTFAFDCKQLVGAHHQPRRLEAGYGPVITSCISVPDTLDGNSKVGRGFLIQDASYPDFINWMIETVQAPGSVSRWVRFGCRWILEHWTGEPETEISARIAELVGPCATSAGSMPMLGMGRDFADGRVFLRRARNGKDVLDVDWRNVRSAAYFDRVRQTSRQLARALGGTFRENPEKSFLNRLITVHPLGGCPMGNGPRDGVVDSYGQVLGHPGFVLADGSVMPGPVGVNPSLTIAALSRRFAHRLLDA